MKLNLKKLAAIVAAVVISANMMAQISVNVGYLNDSRNTTTKLGDNSKTTKAAYNGFTLGASYTYNFMEWMGVTGGVNYQFLNNHQDIDVMIGTTGTKTDINTMIHALDVPIRLEAGYNFTDDLRVFGYVGPKFVFDLAGKAKSTTTGYINGKKQGDAKTESGDIFKDTNYSRFNLMMGPGVGVKYSNFSLRVGYDWGLLNRNTDADSKKDRIYSNNQLYVTLGYSF